MINTLAGTVTEIYPQQVTLDVQSIGFAVLVPDERLYSVGQQAKLFIHFHFNQENGPQLLGFTSKGARSVFSLVTNVSGIGPKIGLAMLAKLTPEQVMGAIMLADIKALSSVSGVGAKKAELLIMHLKDKVGKIAPESASEESAMIVKIKEVSEALSSLNYSRQEISAALEHIKKNQDIASVPFDQLLRKGLSYLAK